jgi:hypothetical protein
LQIKIVGTKGNSGKTATKTKQNKMKNGKDPYDDPFKRQNENKRQIDPLKKISK